jgi:hypothetical protein
MPPGFILHTFAPGYSPLPRDIGPISVSISNLLLDAVLGYDEALSKKGNYFSRYLNKLAKQVEGESG